METVKRDHPIWAAALSLFTWMVSTLPVAFTAWWLLFKGGTIPEWLAHRGVGVGVIGLLLAAWFAITAFIVVASFARTVTIVRELGPWRFDPRAVNVRMNRIHAERLKPTYDEPYLVFVLEVENHCGKAISITGVDGSTACEGELCRLPLVMYTTPLGAFHPSQNYELHLRQGVSVEMARTLLTKFSEVGRLVRFEFNTARLLGRVGSADVVIGLHPASFTFKGPISLESNNQDRIRRVDDVVLSGHFYDTSGGVLRSQ